jgi:hypothetical protein
MSELRGHDGNMAPAPYFRQQVEGAARLSLEVAVREAFPVVEELPAYFIELARHLKLLNSRPVKLYGSQSRTLSKVELPSRNSSRSPTR